MLRHLKVEACFHVPFAEARGFGITCSLFMYLFVDRSVMLSIVTDVVLRRYPVAPYLFDANADISQYPGM